MQPHFPPPPHQTGENFHFVGLTKNFNPSSPAPTPQTDKVSIDIDIDDDDEETRPVKKRKDIGRMMRKSDWQVLG
ncbi:uncharacterized protein C2845_PM02G03480 [Panicum miliaceum]|uniref:Uncharacterized protein n=1 Tax=Panicum miliaceum TaxID=4540 RepID=A0A3L6SEG3_PANMI|nr:uncharacterized protein C2845_PM02G03480 [Panicum miliaceum]